MKANVHIDNNIVKIFGNVIYPNGLYPDKAVRVVLYHRDTNKVFKQIITDKYGYYEFSFNYEPSVIGIYELRFYGTIYPDKLEPEGDWQLIDLTKYDSSFIYYGEENPNNIINWEREPKVGDYYIQLNDNMINSIKWLFTDNGNWVIDSEIEFFIQSLDGVVLTPENTIETRAAYKVNGNIFNIDENSDYASIKLKYNETFDYSFIIQYDQAKPKQLVYLIFINNGNEVVLDTLELVSSSSEYDITPPDNTSVSLLYTTIP